MIYDLCDCMIIYRIRDIHLPLFVDMIKHNLIHVIHLFVDKHLRHLHLGLVPDEHFDDS